MSNKKALKAIQHALYKAEDNRKDLNLPQMDLENSRIVSSDGFRIAMAEIDNKKFPDISQLIKEEGFLVSLVFDLDNLYGIAKIVRNIENPIRISNIDFEGNIELFTKTDDRSCSKATFNCKFEIPCKIVPEKGITKEEVQNVKVALDPKFFYEAINAMKIINPTDRSCSVKISAPTRTLLFSCTGYKEFVMPIFVQW